MKVIRKRAGRCRTDSLEMLLAQAGYIHKSVWLVSAAVFLLVTLVHGKMLSQLTEETGQRQREAISGITDTVMDRVVEESLGKTSLLRADVSDDMFSDLRDRVEMLAFYAEKLFSDPSAAPAAYEGPDPAREGETYAQMILADGVSEEAVADRLGLVANMAGIMEVMYDASEETNSCFIALPETSLTGKDNEALIGDALEKADAVFDERREKYPEGIVYVDANGKEADPELNRSVDTGKVKPEKKEGFFRSFIPMKGDTKKQKIRKIIMLIAIAAFIGALIYVLDFFIFGPMQNNAITGEIQEIAYRSEDPEQSKDESLPEQDWDALKEINDEIVGWITIPDTVIDYPVLEAESPETEAESSNDDSCEEFSYEGLMELIRGRKTEGKEGSYTTYLFEKGLDKILKKVGEESTEVIIAAKAEDKAETVYEIADLAYHVMVLMVEAGISLDEIKDELASRHVIDHKVKQEKMTK